MKLPPKLEILKASLHPDDIKPRKPVSDPKEIKRIANEIKAKKVKSYIDHLKLDRCKNPQEYKYLGL